MQAGRIDCWVTAHVRRRRRLLWTLVLVAALFLETAVVEPHILLVRRIDVRVAGLPEEWTGGTVIQLSDPHLGYPSPAAWRAIDTIRTERPDLVVVTGDVADRRSSIPVVLAWAKQLCEAAGVPVVYVPGNHEHWRFGDGEAMAQFLEQLRGAGFVVLENELTRISRRSGGSPLVIVGLDDSYSHHMDVEAGFSGLAAGERAIVLEHCPDDVTSIVVSGHASLVLTGHTHGGQVRLPVWGDRLTAALEGSPFVRGLYQVDGVPLYVSQGLGMSVLPVRFFCPPEVTVFTLSRP
ncbi:metallophosphoesterase [Candidatus Cryosericum septentrionale]|jgi:predicted MPP superfamily phosphohydrolase|uniref:Metallophosphoesterase n=1 Tax=Candidatus Cryosericum septentrionale TaxID=2290913 RepID=A0A398DNW0_9BACT|nr:metallophosphoesterase [Candidatus Cryosericum septentrionale]RIE17302.1 metallophosphoesterase [Candidatus Cryosericum septentrionale]